LNRRPWLWAVPAALALAIAWLGHPHALPLGVSLSHPWDWPVHAAAFAALSLSLELAWRGNRTGTPVYRRHLAIFALLALLGVLDEGRQAYVPGRTAAVVDWLADLAGAVLGLAGSCLPFFTSRRLAGMGWRRGAPVRPEPRAPLVLVADPHWSGSLTGLAAATAAHPDADWLFLGDVFDVWVGVPGMDTPLEREFLAWVAGRRQAGRWVGFWLGNREYFLDRLADRFDLMGEGTGGGLPAEGLAWEHGDLVNAADWRYRVWNLVSRSGPVWLLARFLPRSAARALAERLQRALHTSNRAYKLAFPRAAFRAAAAEQPGKVFITGHFHTHEVEANGIALPWAHEGRFMVWRDGRVGPLDPPPAP
jgi:VanZ family protein/UDP-2,3-diacylglucosamine pyrophosphatase LpxH